MEQDLEVDFGLQDASPEPQIKAEEDVKIKVEDELEPDLKQEPSPEIKVEDASEGELSSELSDWESDLTSATELANEYLILGQLEWEDYD